VDDLRKFIEGYLAAQCELPGQENSCLMGEERPYVPGYKQVPFKITCLAAERGYEIRVTNQGQLRSWESAEVALRERDRQSLANPMKRYCGNGSFLTKYLRISTEFRSTLTTTCRHPSGNCDEHAKNYDHRVIRYFR
jgi:hypothetical protein